MPEDHPLSQGHPSGSNARDEIEQIAQTHVKHGHRLSRKVRITREKQNFFWYFSKALSRFVADLPRDIEKVRDDLKSGESRNLYFPKSIRYTVYTPGFAHFRNITAEDIIDTVGYEEYSAAVSATGAKVIFVEGYPNFTVYVHCAPGILEKQKD
jgi:hypothetical protein